MIVTLTSNPSIDRTVQVGGTLNAGGVYRITRELRQPGGKGINVATGTHKAGVASLALFPAAEGDPLVSLMDEAQVPYQSSSLPTPARTNLTVVDDAGVTTKINEPGPELSAEHIEELTSLVGRVGSGDRLMLSGSLAPGLPVDYYAHLVRLARERGAWVGVDTSEGPLIALMEAGPDCAPDFLKPNGVELGQIVGIDGHELEAEADAGSYDRIVSVARQLRNAGIGSILVTLGGAGAVLVGPEGAFLATAPKVTVQSTVGAGDSATAGYLVALERGCGADDALALASAYGTAAVTLPGTSIPCPDDASCFSITVRRLD